jgi:hypothetical protein
MQIYITTTTINKGNLKQSIKANITHISDGELIRRVLAK